MQFHPVLILSIFIMGLSGATAYGQDNTDPKFKPDFIIKVPVRFDNLHENITSAEVVCTAHSPEYPMNGERQSPARGVADVGTDDFDGTVELQIHVRDVWAPSDTTAIQCTLGFVYDDGNVVENIDSSIFGPETAFGKNRRACGHDVEWMRAGCTRKDTIALGTVEYDLANAN
jgi:hypothetical protein